MSFSWKEFAAGYIINEVSRGFIYQLYRSKKFDIVNNSKLFVELLMIVDVNKGKLGLTFDQTNMFKTFVAKLSTERRDELINIICTGSSNLPQPYDNPICRGIVMILYLIEQGSISEMDMTITSWGIEDKGFMGTLKKIDSFFGAIADAIEKKEMEFGVEDQKERSDYSLLYAVVKLQMVREGLRFRHMRGMDKLINKKKLVSVVQSMGRTPKGLRVEIERNKRLPFSYRDIIDED